HIAERAGAYLLLRAEPFAAEALGVADDRVELCVGDRPEHARRLRKIGRKRLFDQHRHPALDRGEDRIDVQMLVGRDDGAGDLGTCEQLAVARGDEVGPDPRRDIAAAIGIELGNADPFDRRVARRDFAAEEADTAGADDGEAHSFCGFLHARSLALIWATAESAWFDIGRSTGSPRSAERSAAI